MFYYVCSNLNVWSVNAMHSAVGKSRYLFRWGWTVFAQSHPHLAVTAPYYLNPHVQCCTIDYIDPFNITNLNASGQWTCLTNKVPFADQ